jgi:hypothetical protein
LVFKGFRNRPEIVERAGGRDPGSLCDRSLRVSIAAAAMLGLAACAEIDPVTPTDPPAAPSITESGAPAAAGKPLPPVQPAALTLSQLVGLKSLSSATLIARLGQPDFTRSDPPAELWQYRGATCVLDLFLYPENGTLRVTHVVTRPRDHLDAPPNSCMPAGLPRPLSGS